MSCIRILEGIANEVRNESAPGIYSGGGVWFNLGHPPERVLIPGTSIPLIEGEYGVVAIKPSLVSRLFRQKSWARSDVVIAYTTMNLRGEVKAVGYIWTVACCLFCVCGLAFGYPVTRGLASSSLFLGYLTWNGLSLIPQSQSPELAASLIALISIMLGATGVNRMRAVREALDALSNNHTVRKAQERTTI